MTRMVVCAAIRAEDGDVLIGIRHYSADMHRQIVARSDGQKFCRRHGDDQGFVDQHGAYMTRAEAYRVAEYAGQIINQKACTETPRFGWLLFSEALY